MSERNNIVKSVDDNTKLRIYQDSITGVFKFKGLLANKYNISTRTLGRILKEMEAQEEHPSPIILNIPKEREVIKEMEVHTQEPVPSFVYDYTVTKEAITIFCNEDSRVVTKGYPKFKTIREKLISSDFDDLSLQETFELLSLPTFIEKFSEGNITVSHEEGKIHYGSFEIKNSLVVHMFDIINRGEDVLPMVRFLDMLMDNPKADIVDELYSFMQHNDIQINEDGTIKAYRNVTTDYKDHHTGTMDNSIGKVVKMPRHMVDSNPDNTCSSGIHCASIGYARSFGGGRLMEVKVNPSHVCSVPTDYSGMKMRVCELVIIQEV